MPSLFPRGPSPRRAAPPARERQLDLYRALLFPRPSRTRCCACCARTGCPSGSRASGRRPSPSVSRRHSADDWILPMHRNLGVFTTRGARTPTAVPPADGARRRLHAGPRPHLPLRPARPSHRGHDHPSRRDAAGGRRPGTRRAARGRAAVAAAFTGEGGTREGDFHEALNLAAVWKLPVIFVVENNDYGLSTPTTDSTPAHDLARSPPSATAWPA